MNTPSNDFARREHLGRPWSMRWLRFTADMARLGLDVHELVSSPIGWGGPAVTVPREQLPDVMGGTKVRLAHHMVGADAILYPATVRR